MKTSQTVLEALKKHYGVLAEEERKILAAAAEEERTYDRRGAENYSAVVPSKYAAAYFEQKRHFGLYVDGLMPLLKENRGLLSQLCYFQSMNKAAIFHYPTAAEFQKRLLMTSKFRAAWKVDESDESGGCDRFRPSEVGWSNNSVGWNTGRQSQNNVEHESATEDKPKSSVESSNLLATYCSLRGFDIPPQSSVESSKLPVTSFGTNSTAEDVRTNSTASRTTSFAQTNWMTSSSSFPSGFSSSPSTSRPSSFETPKSSQTPISSSLKSSSLKSWTVTTPQSHNASDFASTTPKDSVDSASTVDFLTMAALSAPASDGKSGATFRSTKSMTDAGDATAMMISTPKPTQGGRSNSEKYKKIKARPADVPGPQDYADILNHIIELRKAQSMLTSFIQSLQGFAGKSTPRLMDIENADNNVVSFALGETHDKGYEKKVHPSLMLDTATGRLACRAPNLQNQPAFDRDFYGIRYCFKTNRRSIATFMAFGTV